MGMRRIVNRGVAVLLLVAGTTVALAPAAQAGHGNGRVRYKGGGPAGGTRVVRVVGHRPVFIERHSDVGPAIAGFLGGLVIGTVLSNAQPAPPPPVYAWPPAREYRPIHDYYDPYCRVRFGSLESYDRHLDRHRHPAVIEIIDVHSGRCVDTLQWQDGYWVSLRDADREYEYGEYEN